MNEEIKQLLYKTKNDEWVNLYEMEMLDDDEIPWERVTSLKKLLKKEYINEDIQICLNAAQILCSWGIDEGLLFLGMLVNSRVDEIMNVSSHRSKGYDQVYENISSSIINYYLRKSDEGDNEEREARGKISPVIKKIISLSSCMMFEIQCILENVKTYNLVEYVPALAEHLNKILDDNDQYWKVVDCVQVLHELDNVLVERLLKLKGVSISQYESDFRV